jgi:hypothetical protein
MTNGLRFIARDQEGNEYTVVSRAGYGPKGGPGMGSLWTTDNRELNHIGKGRYQFVIGGEIITSDDPSAP